MVSNNKKASYPSHATPIEKGVIREHASYTLRPDVLAKVAKLAKRDNISKSAVVEKALVEKFRL